MSQGSQNWSDPTGKRCRESK